MDFKSIADILQAPLTAQFLAKIILHLSIFTLAGSALKQENNIGGKTDERAIQTTRSF
jgi:hypothetical protein